MIARDANVTYIIVIVIATDDGIIQYTDTYQIVTKNKSFMSFQYTCIEYQ